MLMLKRTKDRKTANAVMPNGKAARIANAFSLPAGRNYSCPFATDFCDSICYAGKLERIYPAFKNVVLHNFDLLKDASFGEMSALLSEMIVDFVKECNKATAKGLNAPKLFRIHADGDFFNLDYAMAWDAIVRDFPDIQFWAYTRVPFAAEYLHAANRPNLSLYFSGDKDNIAIARMMERKGVKIAFVADTFAEAREAFKGARCPEQNNKDFGLITEKGSACARCGLCVFNRGNVLFSAKGR